MGYLEVQHLVFKYLEIFLGFSVSYFWLNYIGHIYFVHLNPF